MNWMKYYPLSVFSYFSLKNGVIESMLYQKPIEYEIREVDAPPDLDRDLSWSTRTAVVGWSRPFSQKYDSKVASRNENGISNPAISGKPLNP